MNALIGTLRALGLIATCLIVVGCGTKTGSGRVEVEFSNSTAGMLAAELRGARIFNAFDSLYSAFSGVTPDVYQMKLVAMYIVEDIDPDTQDNVGALTRIWSSNKCDDDLTLCGIGPAAQGYVVDYFDFAQGTSEVNALLNSYRRDTKESTVNPGTYRYIRIDFAGATGSIDSEVPNFKFGLGSENEVRSQQQGLTFALPETLIIAEGESFVVNLAYDLENRLYENHDFNNPPALEDDEKWTCTGTSASEDCIVEAVFAPTVTKE